jgi:protein-S-isoprenylcysteine O-methyltransferase Ste14
MLEAIPKIPNLFAASLWSGWIAAWPTEALAWVWFAWLASWGIGSFWSGRTEKRVRTWESRAYRLPIIAGAVLFTPWFGQAVGETPLWRLGDAATYGLAVVASGGTLFTWWARLYLGELWSNAITRKQDHRLVDTGPYGVVRHPIYTGLITAILATGAAVGTASTLVGAILISFGLWRKARMEEAFLKTELGGDQYEPYCRRVPMLVPSPRGRGPARSK